MKPRSLSVQDTKPDSAAGQAPAALTLLHRDVLARVLDIVGPTRKEAFLDQLLADLGAAPDIVQQAAAVENAPLLRRASHNLTALAATVGAPLVETAARAVNFRISKDATDAFCTDIALLVRLTTRLIAKINALRPPQCANPRVAHR